MNEQTINSALTCQQSLESLCYALKLALDNKNDESILDAASQFKSHAKLCAEHNQYYAIETARSTLSSFIYERRDDFTHVMDRSSIKLDIMNTLCGFMGAERTRNLFKPKVTYGSSYRSGFGRREESYKFSLAEEALFYRYHLLEFLHSEPRKSYHKIALSGPSEWGEHLSIAEAINTFAQMPDPEGAVHLTNLSLFKHLNHYKPAKNTKTNYLKLPDSIKNAIAAHEDLLCKVLEMENSSTTTTPMTGAWIARELHQFGLKKLPDLLVRHAFGVSRENPRQFSFSYSLLKHERSYRVISLLDEMGFDYPASQLADEVLKLGSVSDRERQKIKLLGLVYAFEKELDDGLYEEIRDKCLADMAKYPNESGELVANMLIEMQRTHSQSNPASPHLAARLDGLHGAVGRYITASVSNSHPLRYNRCVENLQERAKDILELVQNSNGYKRGSLSNDLGL